MDEMEATEDRLEAGLELARDVDWDPPSAGGQVNDAAIRCVSIAAGGFLLKRLPVLAPSEAFFRSSFFIFFSFSFRLFSCSFLSRSCSLLGFFCFWLVLRDQVGE